MSTSLVFTDLAGTVTLTNNKPSPGDRFASWTPDAGGDDGEQIAAAYRLGSGQRDAWVFRQDFRAKFELRNIPASKHSDAVRLILWLKEGGTVAVNTGDAASRSYPTCCIRSGSTPALTYAPDGAVPQWTLALELVNVADSPGPLICVYGTYD